VDRERLSIGREAHNAIVIDDPAVSREHAQISAVHNDHILEDLGSANGTYVNGERTSRRILQHGDVIQFGAYHLRYLNPRAASDDLERTMLIEGIATDGTARAAVKLAEAGPDGSGARVPRVRMPSGRIKVVAGPQSAREIELDRIVVTLGRRGEQLAVIVRRPQGYFLSHVEGRALPVVNGVELATEALALRSGDVIEVGDQRVQFITDNA
jgi:pSer/pThr/pTyr-binding forkhead associated (FHA) protein